MSKKPVKRRKIQQFNINWGNFSHFQSKICHKIRVIKFYNEKATFNQNKRITQIRSKYEKKVHRIVVYYFNSSPNIKYNQINIAEN